MRLCQSDDCSNRVACPCRLNFGGVPLPDLCCQHAERFMEYLSRNVPADQGERGLAMWREQHEATHDAMSAIT